MPETTGRGPTRHAGDLAAVAILAAAALAGEPWADARPAPRPGAARTAASLWVSSAADAGPGSLREAIFAAAAARERPRILLASRRVDVATPLPPLVHPDGLELAAATRTELIAGGHGAPALDVAAAGTELRGLTISGARTGVRLRGAGARLAEVAISGCETGLEVAAGLRRVEVTAGAFEGNRIGVTVAPGSAVTIEDSRFADNGQGVRAVAATWMAGEARLSISGNRFAADGYSVVLANVPATVHDNVLREAREAAVYLAGGGARVTRNRVEDAEIGIFADAASGVEIRDNDLLRNRRMGLVARRGEGGVVAGNRFFDNGYGIAALFLEAAPATAFRDNRLERQRHDGIYVLAGAPTLSGNRVTASGGAGLRLADYVPHTGARLVPRPRLEANVFAGNTLGDVQTDEYRQPRPRESAH